MSKNVMYSLVLRAGHFRTSYHILLKRRHAKIQYKFCQTTEQESYLSPLEWSHTITRGSSCHQLDLHSMHRLWCWEAFSTGTVTLQIFYRYKCVSML